jgi:iron complex outermembrane recepter protein
MNISQLRKRMLEASVAVPAIALLGAGFATPAYAQDDAAAACDPATDSNCASADEGPTILVTGSLFRRTNTETASPVTTLSSETLQERGLNSIAEATQRLSANGAGTITQGWNNGSNFATGANAVSLRGLTVQATVTLFDGLRMSPYPLGDDGHRNFVDLNTIPESIVDRIEVLRDGASSTYGADAIAGVVNVITKKEIQGIHGNVSAGTADRGYGDEYRADLTFGYGDLAEQGFNMYVNAEWQKQDPIFARDLDFPFNSGSANASICDPAAPTHCLAISSGRGTQFGINGDGTLAGGTTTSVGDVAPGTVTGGRLGVYQLLNPSRCTGDFLRPISLTAAQAGTTWAPAQCQQDLRAESAVAQPEQERLGFNFRGTARISDTTEAYFQAGFYKVDTMASFQGLPAANATPVPSQVTLSPVVLPVYICPNATAGFVQSSPGLYYNTTNCTVGSPGAQLNPNNPFAAAGNTALLRYRFDPVQLFSTAKSMRASAGINGEVLGFGYDLQATASEVRLERHYTNVPTPQLIADVVARGTFDFVNPQNNSQEVLDYLFPDNTKESKSSLYQVQGTLSRELFELPGGPLQVAVGAAFRHESIDDKSQNPDNPIHPFDRYYLINSVGAAGSRDVTAGFYEVNAPVLDMLELTASGRFDHYSSGQEAFSPKFGFKFDPIREIALRGTWSKGFRIPSFNEAFGLPTTGYTTATLNCTAYAAFCAAHSVAGVPNSYATSPYSPGTTSIGNPNLDPERSEALTLGVIVEPMRNVSFTVDWWRIKVKDLIAGVPGDLIQEATDQYYLNNGVVNIPGIVVRPGVPDVAFPNALPLLGTIEASYRNADSEVVSGVDFGARANWDFGLVRWRTDLEVSWQPKYDFTSGGITYDYSGTLSPCDYTSCSGSPEWRGNWQNSFDIGEDLTVTGTLYYTQGYLLNAVDYGEYDANGDPVCGNYGGAGIKVYKGTQTPVLCESEDIWNFDIAASYRINDNALVYLNILNVFNINAPFDPSSSYGITNYNVAFAYQNAVGRFFRLGARFDF